MFFIEPSNTSGVDAKTSSGSSQNPAAKMRIADMAMSKLAELTQMIKLLRKHRSGHLVKYNAVHKCLSIILNPADMFDLALHWNSLAQVALNHKVHLLIVYDKTMILALNHLQHIIKEYQDSKVEESPN